MKKKKIDVGVEIPQSMQGRHSCKAQGGESAKGTNRTLGIHKQQISISSDEERHNSASICLTSWECRP